MNKKLTAIFNEIKPGRGVIDVGTDHGYVPLALAKSGYPGRIIASDINEGPLAAARRSAAAEGVEERIEFTLADGLELCPPDAVDTIIIAGMGGDMIVSILDRADWCIAEGYYLILQPATRSEIVRYWLINNGFSITGERIVSDAGKLYPIILAVFGDYTPLDDAEMFAGSFELLHSEPLYAERLDGLVKRLEKSVAGMESAQIGEASRLAFTKQVLLQAKELRSRL